MKTGFRNPFLHSGLIASVVLMLACQATPQTFTTLHSFTQLSSREPFVRTNSDGADPYGGLVLSANNLYGTTLTGGSLGRGALFAVNIDGTGFTNLHNFNGSNGANPESALLLSGNTLYGTASGDGPGPFSYGTVFSINSDSTDY